MGAPPLRLEQSSVALQAVLLPQGERGEVAAQHAEHLLELAVGKVELHTMQQVISHEKLLPATRRQRGVVICSGMCLLWNL